jgi:hypothetical protein
MNNNGTGLVLASMAMADHPRVMLPIIFYNMVQHLVAGGAFSLIGRRSGPSGGVPAPNLPGRRESGYIERLWAGVARMTRPASGEPGFLRYGQLNQRPVWRRPGSDPAPEV